MRTSTFARAGAVLTASALALSLGAGPVSAAETQSTSPATTPAAAGTGATSFSAASAGAVPVSAAGIPTSPVRFASGVITPNDTTRFIGKATFTDKGAISATVKVNGKTKGTVPVLYAVDPASTSIAVDIPRRWGSGKVQLDIAGTKSNTFYARKDIKTGRSDGLFFAIRHSGNNVKFTARSVKVINPSNGKYVGLRKIKVQQRKNGKWRTLKTIKMNSKGTGSVTFKTRKKYQYRLKSAKSSKQILFQSESSSKI